MKIEEPEDYIRSELAAVMCGMSKTVLSEAQVRALIERAFFRGESHGMALGRGFERGGRPF